MSFGVFATPPHEPRDVYPTVRVKDGGLKQVEVVEATFLPQPKRKKVHKTVVSMEFLTSMETKRSCIQKPVGKLIQASLWPQGRINTRAFEMAAPTDSTMRRHYYWIENEPHVQMWWRFSLPWDRDRMPAVRRARGQKLWEYMRLDMFSQISEQQSLGPFFAETVVNEDDWRCWIDFYAPDEQDLMMVEMMLA